MTDFEQTEGSSGTRSFLTCLGIGCGVVFVLVLIASIAGYLLKDKIRDSMVDGIYEGMEQEIDASDLDPREKGEVLGQMDRLREGIKADQVSMEEFGALMERVGESPLSSLFLSTTLRAGLTDSSFTSEERAEGEDLLERYVAGRVDGVFSRSDDAAIAKAAGLDREEEGFQIRVESGMKPEKTRAGIALVRAKVAEAGIPAVEESPDLSGLMEELIDPVLD